MERPLEGLRVVDMADERGELCGRILGDLGADVVRVEGPGGGISRTLPPFAPDGTSLFFAHRNTSKRGAVIDLDAPGGLERLHGLLARADVWVEGQPPRWWDERGLDPAQIAAPHPHLIAVSITDFGRTGPYRDLVATDAVVQSMAGMQAKAGMPERPPLLFPSAVAHDMGGVLGTFATLAAAWQRGRTGAGQHIDLSANEALAQTTDWSFPNASIMRNKGLDYPQIRNGSGPVYTVYACKDGYVRLVVLSPRQWRAMRAWIGEPDFLQDAEYDGFPSRLAIAPVLMELYQAHFATMTRDEVSEEAQRRGIVCTPVLDADEVIANVHLVDRNTFVDTELAPGLRAKATAGFYEVDGHRQGRRRPAPAVGQHDAEIEASWPDERTGPSAPSAPSLPLEGLRVLDFGIGGVGVEAGRLFAEYGADVIKIETWTYPDFIRMVSGSTTSPSFTSSSRSKRSFGVNAKEPEGLALLHRLIEQADVIIENGSAGTMEDLGVGWDVVHRLNPRCAMVQSQLLGSHGPWSSWIGYGPSTQPIGGLVHLWKHPDEEFPPGSGAIYPDHLAGRMCAIGALAVLLGREREGAAARVEVAQVETVTEMLGDLLAKAAITPGSAQPMGNRNDRGAPWGTYPAAGVQQWVTITIRDDADWAAFVTAIGAPDWTADPRFATAAGRLDHRDELDELVAAWTADQDRWDVARLLQAAGVPAGPMLTGVDQLDDPHLAARNYPRPIVQPELGPITLEGPCFTATGMTEPVIGPSPQLGEHTRAIAHELLGLDDAEIDRLVESGALEVPKEG
jgi:crotonobetainyl-CoA:carnitine CoA-transferase CaiB-like acyl-CoA transferase